MSRKINWCFHVTSIRVSMDENVMEAKGSIASLHVNHTCYATQPQHQWLVMLLALALQSVQAQAVDTDQPWIHRKCEAVWGLQAAKQQSQAAGKVLAWCQPLVVGCPFGWNGKCCNQDCPDSIWLYLKGLLDRALQDKWRDHGCSKLTFIIFML